MRPLSSVALLTLMLPQTASAFSLVALNYDWAETEEYCSHLAGCSSTQGVSNDTAAGAFPLDSLASAGVFDSVFDTSGAPFASNVATLSHGEDEVLAAIGAMPAHGLVNQYFHAEIDPSSGMKIDRDWYTFTPVAGQCLEVCLRRHAPTVERTVQDDWELAVYDSSLNEVDRISGPGCLSHVSAGGLHYIEVSDPTPVYIDSGTAPTTGVVAGFAHQYYRFEFASGGVTASYFADGDGDGFGAGSAVEFCGVPPLGYVGNASDCDDTDANTHPDASEVCDGADTDCNGTADDGLPTSTWYSDGDGDGFGAEGGAGQDFCADPGAGFAPDATDCDDADSATHPEAVELCDGVDNDCDTMVDDNLTDLAWYVDVDGDGEGDVTLAPIFDCDDPGAGYADNALDCDDDDAAVFSGAAEACNELDDDCDGDVDEGLDTQTWYTDADGDGAGADRTGVELCDDPGDGSTTVGGDCDDGDADVSPAATEACDGIDRDCNGTVDDADDCVIVGDDWDEGRCTCGNAQPGSGWLFALALPLVFGRRRAAGHGDPVNGGEA